MMGPQPLSGTRRPERPPGPTPRPTGSRWSTSCVETLRVEFLDVGAVGPAKATDGARLHRRGLPRATAPAPRPDRGRGIVRLAQRAVPDRGRARRLTRRRSAAGQDSPSLGPWPSVPGCCCSWWRSASASPSRLVNPRTARGRGASPDAGPKPEAGWYADPGGTFEQRYWDGTRWTDEVMTGGRQSRRTAFAVHRTTRRRAPHSRSAGSAPPTRASLSEELRTARGRAGGRSSGSRVVLVGSCASAA